MSASEDYLWIVGTVLVILGSLGQNLGNNLVSFGYKEVTTDADAGKGSQKGSGKNSGGFDSIKSSDPEDKLAEDKCVDQKHSNEDLSCVTDSDTVVAEKKGKNPYWCVGTTIFVTGSLFTFAAFGFAAQSLLASLESIQFVSNVFFVYYVHREAISWRMIIATAAIVIGNILVVIFSDHAAGVYDSEKIIELYRTNSAYWGYLVVVFCMWILMEYLYRTYHHARVVENRIFWRHSLIEPLSYTVSSTIIGTQAVLNSKCLSMLIQVSLRGHNEFVKPTVWVVLATWILFVAYWLRRLDKGLELFPPLFIIPVMQVFFVFFAILCGGIYFEEFLSFTASQYVGFIIGVIMILAGVYGLAPVDVDVIKIVPVDSVYLEQGGVVDGDGNSPALELVDGVKHNSRASASGISSSSNFGAEQITPLKGQNQTELEMNAASPKPKRKIVKRGINGATGEGYLVSDTTGLGLGLRMSASNNDDMNTAQQHQHQEPQQPAVGQELKQDVGAAVTSLPV